MKKEWPAQRLEKTTETIHNQAFDQEDFLDREELKEKTLQHIVFRLDREWYGVEIGKVKEIIKVDKIAYLPSSPEWIIGIINLRGNILSVTDLRTLFNLSQEEPTEKTRIIAVESGTLETGLLVDEVIESIEVPLNKIEPALLTLPAEGGKYVIGECKVNQKLIALLNVEKVLEKRA